jgi:D-alanyl-D-alanine carboxypeptidase
MSEIDLSSVARTVREASPVPFRRAVAVGVRIDGKLVHSEVLYGASAPRSSQTPPRLAARARFPIYSITKTLSALCVLRLAESGRLGVEDAVARWIPELSLPRSITLELVLRHQSGLPEYGELAAYHEAVSQNPSAPWSETQFLDLIRRKGFAFEPGTGWRYSNVGYLLVRKVIEAASGKCYRDAVAEYICRPLELEDTFVAETLLNWSTCVPGFSRELGGDDWSDVRRLYHPGWCAPGVVVSTVEDTTRIFDVLISGKFLKPASLARMLEMVRVPGNHPPAASPSYGFGICGDPDAAGGASFGHGGGGPGYRVECGCTPRSRLGRLSVAVFCNSSGDLDAMELMGDVKELVLGSAIV